ncbi:hypothetical protein [Luteimonas chenhongjianii]|uniref:hypothetical protein n=1 Tax=Luteimonas chenhongjianii TaxID=2006110 RepID=UPI001FE34D7F|nr:hypothetical protein [Luteimonas chenhongjianii]
MKDTPPNFIRSEPISVGGWSSASVFQTAMARSSPMARNAAMCRPSGERVKLEKAGNAASCSMVGALGVLFSACAVWTTTRADAIDTAVSKRFMECLPEFGVAGCRQKKSRHSKSGGPDLCPDQIRTTCSD